jgi:hypothetical protein
MGKITATSKELDDSLAEKRSKVQSPEELVYVSREIRLSIVVQLSDRQVVFLRSSVIPERASITGTLLG